MNKIKQISEKKINKFNVFEYIHLLISLSMIIWHFVIMWELDSQNIPIMARIGNSSNVEWTFTQFTWWTNILITIWLSGKLFLVKRNINNKFLTKIFSNNSYIYFLTYISTVGTLFASGSIYLIVNRMKNENSLQTIKPIISESTHIQNIIITIFVHFINPIVYIYMFIYLYRKNQLNIKVDGKYWILKRISIGMIYPTIYCVFYVSFSLTNYNPYPISNLKELEGLWIAPIIPVTFSVFLFLFSYPIYRKNNLNKNKTN